MLMLLIGTAAAGVVLATSWVDEGEVATLVTLDRAGRPVDTRLWIVDIDGHPYLRAANPDARWLARLRAHPLVHLSRGDGIVSMRAHVVDDPALCHEVDRAMEKKYGRIDRLMLWLRDHSEAVVIRLDRIPKASQPG